jgi:hypothetical protein
MKKLLIVSMAALTMGLSNVQAGDAEVRQIITSFNSLPNQEAKTSALNGFKQISKNIYSVLNHPNVQKNPTLAKLLTSFRTSSAQDKIAVLATLNPKPAQPTPSVLRTIFNRITSTNAAPRPAANVPAQKIADQTAVAQKNVAPSASVKTVVQKTTPQVATTQESRMKTVALALPRALRYVARGAWNNKARIAKIAAATALVAGAAGLAYCGYSHPELLRAYTPNCMQTAADWVAHKFGSDITTYAEQQSAQQAAQASYDAHGWLYKLINSRTN